MGGYGVKEGEVERANKLRDAQGAFRMTLDQRLHAQREMLMRLANYYDLMGAWGMRDVILRFLREEPL